MGHRASVRGFQDSRPETSLSLNTASLKLRASSLELGGGSVVERLPSIQYRLYMRHSLGPVPRTAKAKKGRHPKIFSIIKACKQSTPCSEVSQNLPPKIIFRKTTQDRILGHMSPLLSLHFLLFLSLHMYPILQTNRERRAEATPLLGSSVLFPGAGHAPQELPEVEGRFHSPFHSLP